MQTNAHTLISALTLAKYAHADIAVTARNQAYDIAAACADMLRKAGMYNANHCRTQLVEGRRTAQALVTVVDAGGEYVASFTIVCIGAHKSAIVERFELTPEHVELLNTAFCMELA